MHPVAAKVVVVGGFALHAALLLPYLASGLVVPGPVVPVLLAAWAVFAALAIRYRRRPAIVLAVPFLALVFLMVFVQLGSLLFGWTA